MVRWDTSREIAHKNVVVSQLKLMDPPVGMRVGQNWMTANHVVGENAQDEYTETQERIMQLQKELQAAEAKNSLLG